MDIHLEWSPEGWVVRYGRRTSQSYTQIPFISNVETKEDECVGPALDELGVPPEERSEALRELYRQKSKMAEFNPSVWLGKHPEVHDIYMRHESKWVKYDAVAKRMVFLTALSAYSDCPLNLFVRAPSSTGKTFVTMQTVKYFPQEDVWLLGGLSPTAIYHDYGEWHDENDNIMDMRAIDWKDKSNLPDMSKWKYVVDLKNRILVFLESPHYETYMRLRPILSHDAYEMRYSFTEKSGRGTMRTKHIYLRGWPATVFCSVNPQYQEELATRSINITPEMTDKKYEASIQMQGERASNPWKYENPDPMMLLLRTNLRDTSDAMRKFLAVLPYGTELGQCYPHEQPRDMRDFSKLLSIIQQHTYLHLWQRPWLVEADCEGRRIVLSTMRDFKNAMEVFAYVAETTRSGLPGNVLSFFNEVLAAYHDKNEYLTYSDIVDTYRDVYRTSKSRETLKRSYLNPLMEAGWIDEEESTEDRRRKWIRILHGPEEYLKGFERQFLALFTPERLDKWMDGVKERHRDAKILVNGEEQDWDSFAYFYFQEWT